MKNNSPLGEALKDEKAATGNWDSPYRFNGKELDEETGLYYYGARYYNPQVSVWLATDPLSGLYPHLTPYNFVENNPIMKIDSTGMNSGDYYDENWNWLGNDEIDDGAVYQVEGESRFDINQFKEGGKYYSNHTDFSKHNGDGHSVSYKGQANDLFGEGVDPRTVQVSYSGEWIQKPSTELVSATEGESRFKIRGNPGGKVGVGFTETDYFITGELSAEILANRYVNGSLVESKSVCYKLSITKKVIVGLGVTWGPIKYYNMGNSIAKAPGKIIDGIQYYNYFMNALEQIGESKIIPNEVAKKSF